MTKDLKSYLPSNLRKLAADCGQPAYKADYIFSFIHAKNAQKIADISPLSKTFREKLTEEGFFIGRLELLDKITDPDGTIKFVFKLENGGQIESVLLTDDNRRTLCVSTQQGCAMGCVFCATGKLGLGRDLSAGEIVDQLISAENAANTRINNVVYMGMGEPLANYEAVIDSIKILNNPKGRNIGIRHITVSTVGLPEQIRILADEDIHPRLAVSLNAATDSKRSQIMPVNQKYPLDSIIKALKYYQNTTRDRITLEYVLIMDTNDSDSDAKSLAKLAQNLRCNVNLIEYNPHAGCEMLPASRNRIRHFADILKSSNIETVIRYRRGRSINAACGQLGAKS